MTIFDTISTEFDRLGLVRVPLALERLTSSVGCHILNMSNLADKRFYYGGNLENFRTCVVFMAPSGYSKSQHFNFFLNPRSGILAKSGIMVSLRGTFSQESWMGTISNGEASKGIFSTHKQGIVGADEFMRIGSMMNDIGSNNDEVYLMKALDSDTLTKDLAYGQIEETDIGMTFWAGIRPCILGLKSGMARRFSFQIFLPTVHDSVEFRKASRDGRLCTKVSEDAQNQVTKDIIEALDTMKGIDSIDYSDVEDWVDAKGFIPHFEESIFKRLAAGWSVATGTFPKIPMTPRLALLLENEIISRDVIRSNPEMEAAKLSVASVGRIKENNLRKFMEKNYQLHKVQVDALMAEMFRREELMRDGDWLMLKDGHGTTKGET
jgi:hypothetical protein